MADSNVVLLSNYRRRIAKSKQAKQGRRPRAKSLYELYPLQFFNGKDRCTWAVCPTGNYGADCETGHQFAIQFLRSCDGTVGWSSLLGQIVADMIRVSGGRHDGIVIGFMSVMGDVVNAYLSEHCLGNTPSPAA